MSGVVIVGAGQAGANVARELRSAGWQGAITLVGDEVHLPYERPMLSKELLLGKVEPEQLRLADAAEYKHLNVTLLTGRRATAIDRVARALSLDDGSQLPYEHLVLATGARPRELPVLPAVGRHVRSFRTLDDTAALRAQARAGSRVVIVGAGLIGLELASSLSDSGCEVHLVDVMQSPAPRAFVPQLGEVVQAMLDAAGICCHWHCGIELAEEYEGGVTLALTDGSRLEANLVVASAGTIANAELATEAGIACGNGVRVDDCGRTEADGIWATGDCAEFTHPHYGVAMRLEQWQHAANHAAHIARAICGAEGCGAYAALPWAWTELFGRRIALIGHAGSGAEVRSLGRSSDAGSAYLLLEAKRPVALQGFLSSRTANAVRKALSAGADADSIAASCGFTLQPV